MRRPASDVVIQMSSAGGGVPERTTASGGAGSSGAGAHPSAKKSAGAKADDSGDEMAESTLDLTEEVALVEAANELVDDDADADDDPLAAPAPPSRN